MTDAAVKHSSTTGGVQPVRKRVRIERGALVSADSKVYRISEVLDFSTVVAVDVESGRSCTLSVDSLSCVDDEEAPLEANAYDLTDLSDKDWQVAKERFQAIRPLLDYRSPGRSVVEERAKEVQVNTATLYRWLRKYRAQETVTALVPCTRGWAPGKTRISSQVEDLINTVIKDVYLTKQRTNKQKVIAEVENRCRLQNLKSPGPSAIRERLGKISSRALIRARGNSDDARDRFTPSPGKFPNANFPLAVVQIDHTPADIIIVDDENRESIGRPWITLAMDIDTRMVTGYYVSLDPPSETSVAMCVAQSILPKDEWLLLHGVKAEWPVWGVPKKIHVDNGADFRSNGFSNSCLTYGIELEFRPVKRPKYGGHIERILGTLLREIHDLPGTTFSSVKERDGYDSEKRAVMTLGEFEAWLVDLICNTYHRRVHRGIGMTPTRKWEIGIFGNATVEGVGVPAKPSSRMTLLLDFLPSFPRTVQTFGVTIDKFTYYAECLRPWINATEESDPTKKRDFIFRRDPRNVCIAWFFDPELKQYFEVPASDQSLPSMSLWEYNLVREKLRKEGLVDLNPQMLHAAVLDRRKLVDAAAEKTKKARREVQRRKEHAKQVNPAKPGVKLAAATQPVIPVAAQKISPTSDLLSDDVSFEGDIE